ncbi:MAG: DUF1835 domain-containing protein [Peptostreptococcaceae bacterium]|nr:DUF1835 domain-containing protein [Peptostreptococcaceae bacterium]
MDYTHIVFGDSAKGSLKYFFENNENDYSGEVVGLVDDLSIGPLYKIDEEEGFRQRIHWINNLNKEVMPYFEEYSNAVEDSYTNLNDINKTHIIIIWHGNNANDQVGLRYLLSKLENKNIYEVDVSQNAIKFFRNEAYIPRALGECSIENIEKVILNMKKFDSEKLENLKNDWSRLKDSKENLRIVENGEIIDVEEDFYDSKIVANTGFNFKMAARIIGKTMGESKHLVTDTYIDYRIRKLIEQGKIKYQGHLESMRDYQIRIQGSLNQFFEVIFGDKPSKKDEDGFYHYLLENKNDDLKIDVTEINKWTNDLLENKLILSYNDENIFSLILRNEGREIIQINHTVIDRVKYKIDNENSKKIILYPDSLRGKIIEIKIEPYIAVALKNIM